MSQHSFDTAAAAVLDYILSFAVSHIYEGADREYLRPHGGSTGFVNACAEPHAVGDLVLLSSARQSKWRLSWLIDTREVTPGNPEYLLAALSDRELCWWGNVGLEHFHRKSIQPSWKWNDRQFVVNKRWLNVCYKEKDAYIVKPLYGDFHGDGSVTFGTRTSHGFDEFRPKRTFPDYRKVTRAMMAQCYDDCVAEREALCAAAKAEREASK